MAKNVTNVQLLIGANAQGVTNTLQQVQKNIKQTFNTTQIQTFQQSISNLNVTLSSLGVTAGRVGFATIFGLLSKATNAAMDFESAMADVKKVVDFDTPSQFKEMEQDIISLSQKIPMTAKEISQLVAAGGQSGIARSELIDFAQDAAKMGIAFDISAEQAGQAMAELRTALQMDQSEVTALADTINYLSNTSAASAPKVLDFTQRLASLSKTAGLSATSLSAMGSVIIGAGTAPEIAATGMKNLLNVLTSGNQTDTFTKLNLDAKALAKTMQTDANSAILQVLESISRLPKEDQLSTITSMFGTQSANSVALLVNNLDKLKSTLSDVGDAAKTAGSMEAEFLARIDTAENATQLFKNSMDALSISVGNMLLPALKSVALTIVPIVGRTAEWVTANKELISTIARFAAFLTVAKLIGSSITTMQNAYKTLLNTVNANASREIAIAQAKEVEITNIHNTQMRQRMAVLEKQSLREQNLITQRVLKQKLSSDETVAIISAECAKIEARYATMGAKMRNEMTRTYQHNIAQAKAAEVAQIGGMARVGGAVKTLTTAVWALAGGWIGVAAAIAYATYELANYLQANHQKVVDNTYTSSESGKKYYRDPETGEFYQYKKEKQQIYGYGGQTQTVDVEVKKKIADGDDLTYDDALLAWQRDSKQGRAEYEKEMSEQRLKYQLENTPTFDISAIDMSPMDIGGTGGGSSKTDDYTRKLAQAQERASSLFDEMQEKIASSTSTSLSDMLNQNAKEIAKKAREIEEIATAGVDTDKVNILREQLAEYANAIDTEVRDKWREAYEDMLSESDTATAEALKDYKALAEAEYQATLTRLERERVAKEKELMKDKDDYETRDRIASLYEAKRLQAQEEYNNAVRDAQSKKLSYLIDKGDIFSLKEIITILNASEGIANMENALKVEGMQKYANTYVSIWKDAHRDVSEYLADASESVYSTLTDSMTEFINGTKSAKSAFNDLGNSILNMIAKIAAQRLASTWVSSLMGSIGFSGGGIVTASTGGYISGAGTSTSDSIPAMLSNGEYVIKASSVKAIGINTLDHLNQTGTLKAFANGGYVQGYSSMGIIGGNVSTGKAQSQAPQVIVNISNNSNATAKVENNSYNSDLNRMILDIVIDGASRNVGGFSSNLKNALG